tara:strand:+ start:4 stop:501 length:498 start_codon:yes stop_codon:yes gene_type:complete
MGDGVEVNTLNNCVTYKYHRYDMGTGQVNLKADMGYADHLANSWGFIMPTSGTVKMIVLESRGGAVNTSKQNWKVSNNNANTTTGEFSEFFVQRGGTQNNTGVSGTSHMVLSVAPHASTMYRGSVVLNHTFDALDEIRVVRVDASVSGTDANMYRVTGHIYVEFD